MKKIPHEMQRSFRRPNFVRPFSIGFKQQGQRPFCIGKHYYLKMIHESTTKCGASVRYPTAWGAVASGQCCSNRALPRR